MDKNLHNLKFRLGILEDDIKYSELMKKTTKKTLIFATVGSVTFCGALIFIHDALDAPIKMLNVVTTTLFICASYNLITTSLSRMVDHSIKISKNELEIEIIKDMIDIEEKIVGDEVEDNKKCN